MRICLVNYNGDSEDAGVCGKDGSGFSVEARKPGLKNLRHLLDDDLDKEGKPADHRHDDSLFFSFLCPI